MADKVTDTEVAVKEDKKEVATQTSSNKVANFENGIYGSSDTWSLSYSMAKAMSQSTIVPMTFQKNEANCMLAIAQAQKFGVDPVTMANNMYLIQGKLSLKSEFLIALINNSGKFDMELQYDEEVKDGKPFACTCWTMKDGRRINGIRVDMDMADKEGWTKKNGSKWLTIPQIMLRYRAATFFARFCASELTSGLYTTEEYEDNDFDFVTSKKSSKASLNDVLKEEDIIDGEVVE